MVNHFLNPLEWILWPLTAPPPNQSFITLSLVISYMRQDSQGQEHGQTQRRSKWEEGGGSEETATHWAAEFLQDCYGDYGGEGWQEK